MSIEEQSAHQAPPPAFLKSVINQSKEMPQVEPGNDRDKLLTDLSDSDVWKVIRKFVEAKQLSMAQELRKSVENASVEETGFRFLVIDQVNTFISQLIAFVEAPKEIGKLQNERRIKEEPKHK